MSFWIKSGYSYETIVDLPEEKVLPLLNILTRTEIIEWLAWNDPNGIYSDERSLKELGNVMSKEEGLEIMLRIIEENKIP